MEKEIVYDLKIPKTIESAIQIYGEAYFLSAVIATLRTDSDDQVAAHANGGKRRR